MGGALSQLAALKFQKKYPHSSFLIYTFGQPRLGNADFSDYFMQKFPHSFYRIVHGDDWVVSLPPSSFLGYKHSGHEIWYPDDAHTEKFIECRYTPGP